MRSLALLAFCLVLSSLSGCIHRLDAQQGNIISNKTVQELKPGMTQAQVESLLGAPVLVQNFNDRISYIYTWRSDETPYHEKSVTLFFSNGHLVRFVDDFQNK